MSFPAGQHGHQPNNAYKKLFSDAIDGRIEIDNNAAERALRGVALGRKNYLFLGSDAGGERAATITACWAQPS